jgi:uncharacterized protein (TIGR02246 family)
VSYVAGTLYLDLLAAWNARSADAFAMLFAEDGHVVGFDGSPMKRNTADDKNSLPRHF